VGGIVDFLRFGTVQLQTNDWISVAIVASGLTMVSLGALDMMIDNQNGMEVRLFAPQEYENIYLENDPNVVVVDEMAGLGMDS
jgi:phosphatidylglycerophosphatase A